MDTKQVLKILHVVAWILFIGLCIKTGAMLISFLISLFNPEGAKNLYLGMNLSELHNFSLRHYIGLMSLMLFLSGLKAYLFYLVVKIISKINVTHPFSVEVGKMIATMSRISLQIGLIALISIAYAIGLMKQQIHFSYEKGGTEFLFLAAILFVIAQIFKRGIELQSENELTV